MIIKSLIPILVTAMDVPLIRAAKYIIRNHFKYMVLVIMCKYKAEEEHLEYDKAPDVSNKMTTEEFNLHFKEVFNSDNIYHIGMSKITRN